MASPAPQVPVLTVEFDAVTRGDTVALSPAAMSRAGAPRSAWKSRWSLASSFIMGQVPTALGSAPGAADQQNGPPWSGGKIKTNAPHRERCSCLNGAVANGGSDAPWSHGGPDAPRCHGGPDAPRCLGGPDPPAVPWRTFQHLSAGILWLLLWTMTTVCYPQARLRGAKLEPLTLLCLPRVLSRGSCARTGNDKEIEWGYSDWLPGTEQSRGGAEPSVTSPLARRGN